jgi:hypothetical protein
VTVIEEEEVDQMQISTLAEEEHPDEVLTPWEKELKMMKDRLNHPEYVNDFHEQTVM